MTNYNTLRYEVAEHILTLSLNRPDQMNAFTVEMSHELIHAFNRASDDDDVGALDHPLKAHQVDSLAIFYASQTSGKEGVASFLEKRPPVFKDKASTDMPDFYPWWS